MMPVKNWEILRIFVTFTMDFEMEVWILNCPTNFGAMDYEGMGYGMSCGFWKHASWILDGWI